MNKLIRNLKKRISILESYRANSDIEYRYKTTGRFIQNGEIIYLINTLANLPTNKEDAINFVISELTKLINAEEEILNTKKRLKDFLWAEKN